MPVYSSQRHTNPGGHQQRNSGRLSSGPEHALLRAEFPSYFGIGPQVREDVRAVESSKRVAVEAVRLNSGKVGQVLVSWPKQPATALAVSRID